jgi:hypothetical protein
MRQFRGSRTTKSSVIPFSDGVVIRSLPMSTTSTSPQTQTSNQQQTASQPQSATLPETSSFPEAKDIISYGFESYKAIKDLFLGVALVGVIGLASLIRFASTLQPQPKSTLESVTLATTVSLAGALLGFAGFVLAICLGVQCERLKKDIELTFERTNIQPPPISALKFLVAVSALVFLDGPFILLAIVFHWH